MSKGEEKIKYILDNAHISYVREKIFPSLRTGKLRFDFYLPNSGVLIEYDGQQHFQQVKKFQLTKKDFDHAKQNDYYKNSYALAHRMSLYRVPYWEIDNINSISDILSPRFLVKSKWHNDIIYREYKGGH